MIKHRAQQSVFQKKLASYKQLIDADIKNYSRQMQTMTLQHYGASARLEVDSFLSILERGGKRIRGALVMLGYEMSGGRDESLSIQAARAIEMMHAYILIIDDIQDRSRVRRGGPVANVMLADYHRQAALAGDADHFGVALALNGALSGAHAAQMLLAKLPTDAETRLKIIISLNQTMLVTAHGQTHDLMNEVVADVSQESIEQVLEWKTAEYSFLSPLQIGMIMAGADDQTLNAIREYALHVGKAYQITDDILGTFGAQFESGKSPQDDMREGKRTLLAAYALERASTGDKNFLLQMLGNEHITPSQFDRCKDILQESGALKHAMSEAEIHVHKAVDSLEREAHRWQEDSVTFLYELAKYILERQS